MAGRPSDPNTRRLRRFVLLVIFAVTLPSLMLSGFGLIAINNERVAARLRIQELYGPVARKLAMRLKQHLKNLVEQSDRPLRLLADWGLRRIPAPQGELDRFLDRQPALANFFVLDADGKLLVPRSEPPLPSWAGYLPEPLLRGRRFEFASDQPLAAAAVYRSLLGEVGGEAARCKLLNAVRLGLGRPELFGDKECHPPAVEESAPWLRCLARNGLARSLDRAGQDGEAAEEWGRLADSCPRFVDANRYNLALGARLRRIELLWPGEPQRVWLEAARLARALADPLLPAFAEQKRFIASRAAELLRPAGRSQPVVSVLRHMADDLPLLVASRELPKLASEGVSLRSVPVEGVRRMLVVRKQDGMVAGAEVLAARLEPKLQSWLAALQVGAGARIRIRPATQPFPEDTGGLLAGSVLLTDGQFAWRLDLSLEGGDALEQLTRTRARLYLWILVLAVLVLVMGIAGTVWVMVRETRLSRLKTDFVSSVSHELRTPLTSIRLFTETLLLGRAGSPDEQQEFLQIISRESERLSRLVERILDFSRMEAGRKAYSFRSVEVSELVGAAVSACRSLLDERCNHLRLELPDDLPSVEADRDALVEVLINLLSNAVKYSPQGSEVVVAARCDADWLSLSIIDHGIGIPRAEQGRIFEKFYRVETPLASEVSGSGLGLSLVRYIVDGHGGRVLVDSVPGKGSSFTVRLPLRHDAKR